MCSRVRRRRSWSAQIIRALDGPLAPIACASRAFYRRCEDCPQDRPCTVRLVMVQVRDAIAAVLDARSLAEMRTLAETEADGLMYHI